MRRRLFALFFLMLFGVCAAACAEMTGETDIAEENALAHFYYRHGGYLPPESCEIVRGNDGYDLIENDETTRPVDETYVAEIQQIIEVYDMAAWNGFHESNPYILDGEGFSLGFSYSDGTVVWATGNNAFPDNYDAAIGEINAVLMREKMSGIAGTYRYEGEGFGGDFTITLNSDGTYIFYEGPLSSYIGAGTWDIHQSVIQMSESEENGTDLSFLFGYEEGALIYLSAGSDAFPYTKIPDEGRFIRTETAA